MSDPMIELIGEAIKTEKCVLLLGPELLAAPGEPTAQEKLLTGLQAKGFEIEPDLDHFFNLKKLSGSKKKLFEMALRAGHESLPDDPLFARLAELPFHLYISLMPDARLQRAFDTPGYDYAFQFYDKKSAPAELSCPPTAARPLVYNLFGSISEQQSLIYTYNSLFEFVFAILGKYQLHTTLQYHIKQARLFLFLGFDFDRWYVKLLLRLLFEGHDDPLPLTNHSSVADETARAFFVNNFQMEFIPADIRPLVNTLHEEIARQKRLRRLQEAAPLPTIDKRQRLTILTGEYETLTEKLARLRKDRVIETDSAIKFKLDKQLEEVEAELKKIEAEIEQLSK